MNATGPKILYFCTEDWFFRSHFLPLIKAAQEVSASEIVLVTTAGNAAPLIAEHGVRIIPVDFRRQSFQPIHVLGLLWTLSKIIREERADILHFISLKPILMGGLAALGSGASRIYHLTGLGLLSETSSLPRRIVKAISLRYIAYLSNARGAKLVVENSDDQAAMIEMGARDKAQIIKLGGAGLDENAWPAQPHRDNSPVGMAFIGRMIWTKGVDVLVAAADLLNDRDINFDLRLYGKPDEGNRNSISQAELEDWNSRRYVSWNGFTDDPRKVWSECQIAIVPTRTREGLPRSLLEAAASARALVVTDIPGCREFVRDGVEGMLVRPDDPESLADALELLVGNAELRKQMGEAARQRLLNGFTENHVIDKMKKVYGAVSEKDA